MSKHPFRHHHALEVLRSFDSKRGPLDRYLHLYFRANSALGSKDRREVAELVYGVMRWHRFFDAENSGDCSWEARLSSFLQGDPAERVAKSEETDAVRASFPDELYTLLVESHGEEQALEIALASNQPAPLTLRANLLKGSRDQLIERLSEEFTLHPGERSASAIRVEGRAALFAHPAFKEGLFEIQDEGSQLLADLVQAKPGDHFLDYCAGAGGKSLAIAPQLEGHGQLYLYDIRQHALAEAKKRMKRAGIENVQYLEQPKLKRLRGRMDWVLVDAPCSGTGTLRRNPDMKWRFDKEELDRLVALQREIVAEAVRYLKPKGRLVYATCSILKQENDEQVRTLCEELGLAPCGESFSTLPGEDGMDGFFGVVLEKK